MYNLHYVDYFDVWGNPADGYEVNNLCELYDDIETPDLETETLINELKARGYFTEKATPETITTIDYYPFIEMEAAETGEPLGRFMVIE